MKLKTSIKIIVLFICVSLLFSFSNETQRERYFDKIIPAGTIKIGKNLFVDQEEVRNLDWREYLYWTGRVYGKTSNEYIVALPDTNVWLKLNLKCIGEEHMFHYLRHPAYQNYPVVGINQNAEKHFSIQNYFEGKYNDIEPDINFL